MTSGPASPWMSDTEEMESLPKPVMFCCQVAYIQAQEKHKIQYYLRKLLAFRKTTLLSNADTVSQLGGCTSVQQSVGEKPQHICTREDAWGLELEKIVGGGAGPLCGRFLLLCQHCAVAPNIVRFGRQNSIFSYSFFLMLFDAGANNKFRTFLTRPRDQVNRSEWNHVEIFKEVKRSDGLWRCLFLFEGVLIECKLL